MELDRNNLNTNSNTIKAYQMYPMKSSNVDLIRHIIQKKRMMLYGHGNEVITVISIGDTQMATSCRILLPINALIRDLQLQ